MTRKLMRGVGLALIAMPEPFTTPLGVSLLALSWVLAKRHDARKRAYLRHLLGEYLHSYRPFGYGMSPKPVVHTYASPGDGSFYGRQRAATRIGSRGYTWPDQPKNEFMAVHHSYDPSEIRRRLSAGGSRHGIEGYWGRKSYVEIKPIRHSIGRALSLA